MSSARGVDSPSNRIAPPYTDLLVVDRLTKRFGGLFALADVSIGAPRGQVTGLIGPNGSGKSTLFDAITGVVARDGGHVWFNGALMERMSLTRCVRRGLVRTFQVPRIARSMTVLQHLMMTPRMAAGESVTRLVSPWQVGRIRQDEQDRLEAAIDMVETLKLGYVRNDLASSLSGGQLKLLSLGMALLTGPEMLLLDEPVAGVHPLMIEVVISLLRKACSEGVGVLLIEHNMSVMWEICSTVYALSGGRVIAHSSPQELQHDPVVIDAYLGRSR